MNKKDIFIKDLLYSGEYDNLRVKAFRKRAEIYCSSETKEEYIKKLELLHSDEEVEDNIELSFLDSCLRLCKV